MGHITYCERNGQNSLYTSQAEIVLIGGSADGRWDIPGYNYGLSQFQEFASKFPEEAALFTLHSRNGNTPTGKVVYIARRDKPGAYFGICVIKRSATERPEPKLLEQCLGQIATAVAHGLKHVAMPKLCCGSSDKYLSFPQMAEMVRLKLGHYLQDAQIEIHCGKGDATVAQNITPIRRAS